jgi:hypothetical protein
MDRLRLAELAGQLDESTLQLVNSELSPAESRTQAMHLVQLGVAVADAPGAARPRQ